MVTNGTHWGWVPPFTGSRLPTRWVEVDDSTNWAGAHVSAQHVHRSLQKNCNGQFTAQARRRIIDWLSRMERVSSGWRLLRCDPIMIVTGVDLTNRWPNAV